MLDQYPDPKDDLPLEAASRKAEAVLAGGCFWCVEAVYEGIPGVIDAESGYAGGEESTANYDAVSTGRTGHAEVVRITYDPSKATYGQLLKAFFFIAHDPTTLNRQGPDSGTQYRSAIFYSDEDQRRVAEAYIKQIDQLGHYPTLLVTTLEPLTQYYPAEKEHQDFARLNPAHPYIARQALPKVAKLRKAMG
ncbi:MAG: peptide-methionine (S)-S-oxide reductase MsrA [Burkholderiales bacterium]|nr:peptide-methionine (S)-S-oxide reductase MsrA [Phycisphaerae bacterium]